MVIVKITKTDFKESEELIMFGLLATAIFGGACVVDSAQKSMRDADARARYTAEGKPYYPTSDNNYIYIPTGEKCYITTETLDTAGSYRKVLRSIPNRSNHYTGRTVYVFPERTKEEKAAEFERYLYDARKKRGLIN